MLCKCGHTVDDHVYPRGGDMPAGGCKRCDCACYEERNREEFDREEKTSQRMVASLRVSAEGVGVSGLG